jgi:hypothetical protein
MPLSIKPSQPPMQASKWLKNQVLLDTIEMQMLMDSLGDFEIYLTSSVIPAGQGSLSHVQFLEKYAVYIEALKRGEEPDEGEFRQFFSSVWTSVTDHLYAISVGQNQQLIRVLKPVIQLQTLRLDYSLADGKFYSKIFGTNSISWGIQFSFPQLYLDPATQEAEKTLNHPELFPNVLLFQKIQKWVRNYTIPTSFVVEGKKINVPVRIGKNALSWINKHAQLIKKQIKIADTP